MKKFIFISSILFLSYCGSFHKENPKLDILVVLDNSGSMSFYKDNVIKGLKDFFKALDQSSIDYRIALTTTDMSQAGKKACFTNSKADVGGPKAFYISRDKKDREKLFSDMLDLAEIGEGHPDEEIFRPILESIKPDKTKNCNETLRREDTYFASIFIGDSQDSALVSPGKIAAEFYKNIKEELFLFYALIPNAGKDERTNDQCFIDLSGKSLGFSHLKEFANFSKGLLMDLCAEPYSDLLKDIKNKIKKEARSL